VGNTGNGRKKQKTRNGKSDIKKSQEQPPLLLSLSLCFFSFPFFFLCSRYHSVSPSHPIHPTIHPLTYLPIHTYTSQNTLDIEYPSSLSLHTIIIIIITTLLNKQTKHQGEHHNTIASFTPPPPKKKAIDNIPSTIRKCLVAIVGVVLVITHKLGKSLLNEPSLITITDHGSF